MQNQTLSDLAKLMERGLIVIPKSIRDKAGLEKGVRVEKTKYDKQAGMKILSQNSTPLWLEKDDAFLAKGRKQIEAKLKKNDQP